jgi:hypothetical protein
MHFAHKAGVVGQLWIEFRNDENFSAFIEHNDLGCPLGYMVHEGIVNELSPLGEELINETYTMLLELLEYTEEEVDEIDDPDLPIILEMAHAKKQAKNEVGKE